MANTNSHPIVKQEVNTMSREWLDKHVSINEFQGRSTYVVCDVIASPSLLCQTLCRKSAPPRGVRVRMASTFNYNMSLQPQPLVSVLLYCTVIVPSPQKQPTVALLSSDSQSKGTGDSQPRM